MLHVLSMYKELMIWWYLVF